MTAAFRLKQRGVPVILYEAADRVGGVIQTVRRDGYLAEFGPNSILETSPKISALVRDLGLESRRLYSDPAAENRYVVRGGRPVRTPDSLPDFIARRCFRSGPSCASWPSRSSAAPAGGVEETVAEFVLRRLGQEFLDYAIDPMVAGVYAGDPALLSVSQAFPKLHAARSSAIAPSSSARSSARANANAAARSPNRTRRNSLSTTACRC